MDDRINFTNIKETTELSMFDINQEPSVVRPLILSRESMAAALRIVGKEEIVIESLDRSGLLRANILRMGNRTFSVEVVLFPDGRFENRVAGLDPYALAAVLQLMSILSQKKRSRQQRMLLAAGPEWLTDSFRLGGTIEGGFDHAGLKGARELSDLQAYWSLSDMASGKTGKIPPHLVMELVLNRYGRATWHLQRTAMSAVLSRIASIEAEGLKVGKRPEKGPMGFYGVKRVRESLRPYEVLISSGTKLDAACSCPDFAKNTLRFCKHIAAVYQECFGRKSTQKIVFASAETVTHRVLWDPPIGLSGSDDPLLGLFFVPASRRGPLPKSIAELFTLPANGRLGLGRIPLRSDPVPRLTLLDELTKVFFGNKNAIKTLRVDPSVKGVLERERGRLVWPASVGVHKTQFESVLDSLKVKLYPYQREGVLRALSRGRFLLGDDMGLGKTTQAIAWAEALLKTNRVQRVLVICPAALKSQWRREWELVSQRRVQIVEGPLWKREEAYRSDAEVLVVNYELILRDIDTMPTTEFTAVILDEAQRIKNYATQTALKVKRLTPPFRLILTGTPMENRLSEFASLMDWIDSDALGPFWRLEAETSYHDGVGHGKRGVRGLNLIRQRAAPHFLRRTRKEVLTQLPERTDSVIPVEPTEEQLSIHMDLASLAARLMAIAERRRLTPEEHLRLMSYLTRMRIVSNGLAQYEFDEVWPRLNKEAPSERALAGLFSPKLGVFRGLMEGLLCQEGVKIVVFSQWRKALRLAHWSITDVLCDEEAEAVFFTGAEDLKRRTENIVRFHDDPEVRVFFSTDAGGVGLNLQRAATVCVNFELPWNPAVLEQRIGRIYRLGQDKPVQIFNLVTQNTIETRITELIANKRAVFDALFDGKTDEVSFDESSGFMNQVREVVQTFSRKEAPEIEESDDPEALAAESANETQQYLTGDSSLKDPVELGVLPETGSIENETDAPPPTQKVREVPQVAELMRGIRFERAPDGALRIEADGPAAAVLSEAFLSMGRMFGALASSPAVPEERANQELIN